MEFKNFFCRSTWNSHQPGSTGTDSIEQDASIQSPISFDTPEADRVMSAIELFPADNAWNIPVDKWPVASNSKQMVQQIGASKPFRANNDMGYVIVPSNQNKLRLN